MSWKPKEFAQCLPCVVAKNGKESIKFYTTAFGFKELENTSVDEHGDVQHAMLQLGEVTIMLTPEGAFGMPHLTPISSGVMSPVGLYIYVEDIDKFYDQAVAAGATEPMFFYSKLNDIKPEMLKEAGVNAYAGALELARNTSSQVGKIKDASQGAFSIRLRNDSSEYGHGGYGKPSPYLRARVVTNVTYFIND